MLAHAAAVRAYRAVGKHSIGIVVNDDDLAVFGQMHIEFEAINPNAHRVPEAG